jgi:hypothetical protein
VAAAWFEGPAAGRPAAWRPATYVWLTGDTVAQIPWTRQLDSYVRR